MLYDIILTITCMVGALFMLPPKICQTVKDVNETLEQEQGEQ